MNIYNTRNFFGSFINNFKLTNASVDEIELIKKTLFDRKVVFLENQFLTKQEMIDIAQQLRINNSGPENEYSEINNIENPLYGVGFHSDKGFYKTLPWYTIFQIDEHDESTNGDTIFCDTETLLSNGLSKSFQNFIESLTVINEYSYKIEKDERKNITVINTLKLIAEHPAVITTEFDGLIKKSLFIDECFATSFKELTAEESKKILDIIKIKLYYPEFHYRHSWKKGSVVIWNNRLCMHKAVKDMPSTTLRAAKRCVIF